MQRFRSCKFTKYTGTVIVTISNTGYSQRTDEVLQSTVKSQQGNKECKWIDFM